MSYNSSFDITNVVVLEPRTFFGIPASVAEVAAFNPSCKSKFLASGIATFINGPAILLRTASRNLSECIILIFFLMTFMDYCISSLFHHVYTVVLNHFISILY